MFLPLKIKGGFLSNVKYNKNQNVKHVNFLTEDQAEFICKKVNAGRGINTKTIQQEINSNSIDTNPYKRAILDEEHKKKDPTQIEY